MFTRKKPKGFGMPGPGSHYDRVMKRISDHELKNMSNEIKEEMQRIDPRIKIHNMGHTLIENLGFTTRDFLAMAYVMEREKGGDVPTLVQDNIDLLVSLYAVSPPEVQKKLKEIFKGDPLSPAGE